MIGRDYPDLGSIHQQQLGRVQACISAGSDPNSPSFAFKGDKVCPNEDGLVVLKDGERWLLAVADGHLGHHSSHALLDGLSRLPTIPSRLGQLSLALSTGEWIDDTAGGTTLLVMCIDINTGVGFGLSFGDSSLVILGSSGARVINDLNQSVLSGGGPIDVENGRSFQLKLAASELLVLYTDGVNECCYRDPFRSIRLQHLDQLYTQHHTDQAELTRSLTELALSGVDGHPGGQDNVVVLSLSLPQNSLEEK